MAANTAAVATVAMALAFGLGPWDRGPRPERNTTGLAIGPPRRAVPAEWLAPTTAITTTGQVSYYAAGIMARVAANRGLSLEGYAGGVAMMRRGDLGRVVWLRPEARSWVGPFLVVDCARRGHYAGLVKRGRVVEVDRAIWLELGLPERPVPVVVSFEAPGDGSGR